MDLKLTTIIFLQFFSVLYGHNEDAPCSFKDGTEGVCKKFSKCSFAKKDLKRLKFPKLCSHNILKPTVCCIKCTETEEAAASTQYIPSFLIPGYGQANDRCLEEYYIKVPCNQLDDTYQNLDNTVICYEKPEIGYSADLDDRIDQKSQFPHMALIGYGETPSKAAWMCGGSVINDRYILTIANCISSPAMGDIKYAGLGILRRTDPISMWQLYDITNIIAYPDYEPPSKYHDIALLATGARIRYNKDVLPACLPKGLDLPVEATALGWWGASGYWKRPRTSQSVSVIKLSDGICSIKYPKHRHLLAGYNATTQVCYGDEDIDSDMCEGDRGGPLQVRAIGRQESKCLFTIVGVTSFGRSCGFAGSTGLYTRVDHYVSWIEEITGKLS